jgi:hypothetical protein
LVRQLHFSLAGKTKKRLGSRCVAAAYVFFGPAVRR